MSTEDGTGVYKLRLVWAEEVTVRVAVPERENIERGIVGLGRVYGLPGQAIVSRRELARGNVQRCADIKRHLALEYGARASFGKIELQSLDIVAVKHS